MIGSSVGCFSLCSEIALFTFRVFQSWHEINGKSHVSQAMPDIQAAVSSNEEELA